MFVPSAENLPGSSSTGILPDIPTPSGANKERFRRRLDEAFDAADKPEDLLTGAACIDNNEFGVTGVNNPILNLGEPYQIELPADEDWLGAGSLPRVELATKNDIQELKTVLSGVFNIHLYELSKCFYKSCQLSVHFSDFAKRTYTILEGISQELKEVKAYQASLRPISTVPLLDFSAIPLHPFDSKEQLEFAEKWLNIEANFSLMVSY